VGRVKKEEVVLYEIISPHIMWQCKVDMMWTQQHGGVINPSKEEKTIFK